MTWKNWWRLGIAFVRLAFKRKSWALLGAQLRCIKDSLETLEIIVSKRTSLDVSDRSEHPTAGRRRKHKIPAVAHLAPPVLRDHLRGDDDGPICSDKEKEVK